MLVKYFFQRLLRKKYSHCGKDGNLCRYNINLDLINKKEIDENLPKYTLFSWQDLKLQNNIASFTFNCSDLFCFIFKPIIIHHLSLWIYFISLMKNKKK